MKTVPRILIAAVLLLQAKYNVNLTMSMAESFKLLSSRRKDKIFERNFDKDCIYEDQEMDYTSPDEVEDQVEKTLLSRTTLNDLRKAMFVHPFQTWKLKRKYSSMKDIRIDEDLLHAVIHNARNERLKQKLHKVLQGEDVYMDVFGGSNTAGGTLWNEVGGINGVYPKVIAHWWDKAITSITGSNLKLREIGLGGTSSEFFQLCFVSYIHKQLDLVFLEMSVNDIMVTRDYMSTTSMCLPLEQLTRQLLEYPSEAAVLYVNLFFQGCKGACSNLQDHGQDDLTDTYNITSLNWRECFCNCPKNIGINRCAPDACDVFSADGFHINQLGHAHIALMTINLFRRILLDHISNVIKNSRVVGSRENESTRGNEITMRGNLARGTIGPAPFASRDPNQAPREISRQKPIPPPVFIKKTSNVISEPLCWTSQTPNIRKTGIIDNNLNVVFTKTGGFYVVKNQRLGERCDSPCRGDGYDSWTGRTVGATTSLSFTVPARISSDGIKSRSVAIAVRTCWPCGAARMWFNDDNINKKYVTAKHKLGITSVTILALHVEPGRHALNIEIVEEGKLPIVALMIGPPDGPY